MSLPAYLLTNTNGNNNYRIYSELKDEIFLLKVSYTTTDYQI